MRSIPPRRCTNKKSGEWPPHETRHSTQPQAGQTDLEGDGEVAEALSEDPDNGVAEPGDDSDASDLRIDRARLTALGLGSLRPRLAQREDDVQEPAHAEEPPHPLDVTHGQCAKGPGRDHEDCRQIVTGRGRRSRETEDAVCKEEDTCVS